MVYITGKKGTSRCVRCKKEKLWDTFSDDREWAWTHWCRDCDEDILERLRALLKRLEKEKSYRKLQYTFWMPEEGE